MSSFSVARRLKAYSTLLAPFMLASCPYPAPLMTPPNKPAEIMLPPTASPQAFRQVERDLAQFVWGPSHDAPCTGCQGPGDVTIRYTGKTTDVKANDGPVKRRIVALIENSSSQDVAHTPSGTTFKANTKYLMWVHRRGDGKAIWGFIELGPAYTSAPQAIGLLHDCGHRPLKTRYDDADFRDCNDARAFFRPVRAAYAAPRTTAYISKPGWIWCDPDCCTGAKD